MCFMAPTAPVAVGPEPSGAAVLLQNKEPSMTFRAILALSFALLAVPVWAQTAKPEKAAKSEKAAKRPAADDPVVARVNGTEMHRSEAIEMMRELPAQLQKQPQDRLYSMVLGQWVDTQLVSQEARKNKVQDDPAVK